MPTAKTIEKSSTKLFNFFLFDFLISNFHCNFNIMLTIEFENIDDVFAENFFGII